MDLTTMSVEERATAIAAMSNDDLATALAAANTQASALFALEAATVADADTAEALAAIRLSIETEQSTRAAAVKDAEDRFATAKAAFAVNDGVESSDDEDEDESEDETEAAVETDAEGESGEADAAEADAGSGEAAAPTVTASGAQRISTARKVGAKTKRPAVKSASPVTITAAADVPGFATGKPLTGMEEVAKALMGRVKGFAPFNKQAAQQAHNQSGGTEVLNKFGVASFSVNFDPTMVADGGPGKEYEATKAAIKAHTDAITASMSKDLTLTAAGWCAPSEQTYNYLADYVIDGIKTVPQVSAPRGGLMTTTGPALADTYALDGSDFGFVQTEAQAEAGTVKTCETIICPAFTDHRLDAMGYCWKIPLLTQKAYPELVADALRLSNVLYAHKRNARRLTDILADSTAVSVTGLGATFTDTLEALTIVAVRERRKWNIGENAVMEVTLPTFVKEVFRADVSRRMNQPVGAVTDQQIISEFTARNLSVEFVADLQDLPVLAAGAAVFPGTFEAIIYPAGTFAEATEDVINLSAVYDAASLSVNEYTGVFFEQGVMTLLMGYRSSKMTVPICTAGLVGAAVLDCNASTGNFAGGETPPVV